MKRKRSISCQKLSIFFCLIICCIDAKATIIFSDTLILKTGECIPLAGEDNDRRPLIWTTGNQDIANIESVFGKPTVCGVFEGITYVSGSKMSSEGQHKIIIKVIQDSSSYKAVPRLKPPFRSSVDEDVEELLRKITYGYTDTDTDTKLDISENKRYLVYRNTRKHFLFLSQTLWSMTRRLSREQIIQVLDICKDQGFTAIQLIAHSHYMGPNIYGKTPFENENFLRPVVTAGNNPDDPDEYDWWDHLEFIVNECINREMFICLLPTWREQWNHNKNLHENNAFAYGKFIGQRYRRYNPWIIWVMGGDEAPDTPLKLNIHRELARGIALGINSREDYTNILMTYHTHGPTITTDFISEDELFMDFNTVQSGHNINNLEGMIERSWQAQKKPVMDFEPYYTKDGNTTHEARTAIYWGVFSGGFGTSSGSWNLWHCGARNDLGEFKIPQSFFEGFGPQIRYLGDLLSNNTIMLRVPNQEFLVDNQTKGADRILACTAPDKSYALVYSPHGEAFTADITIVDGKRIYWYWFNPRNGEIHKRGSLRKTNTPEKFVPPTNGPRFSGNDWVLIIENGRKKIKFNNKIIRMIPEKGQSKGSFIKIT